MENLQKIYINQMSKNSDDKYNKEKTYSVINNNIKLIDSENPFDNKE